jgi:hypothetical protein
MTRTIPALPLTFSLWNLCKAPPVDMQSLAVGMRVQAVGAATGEGGLVVCQDAAHRLEPMQ